MRQDHWDSVADQFAAGGLRHILSKGAHFPDCRHLASTFTASTLATLATGAWPAQHGIVADSWYDRTVRGPVGASQEALLATTLTAQVAAEKARYARLRDRPGCPARLPLRRHIRCASVLDGSPRPVHHARGTAPMAGRVQCAEAAGQLPQRQVDGRPCASPARRPCAPSPMTRTIRSDFLDLFQASPLRPGRAVRIPGRPDRKGSAGAEGFLRFRLRAGRLHGPPGVTRWAPARP